MSHRIRFTPPAVLIAMVLVVLSGVLLLSSDNAAHAQSSPSAAVSLSPSTSVESGTEITVTMSFSNLEADADTSTTDAPPARAPSPRTARPIPPASPPLHKIKAGTLKPAVFRPNPRETAEHKAHRGPSILGEVPNHIAPTTGGPPCVEPLHQDQTLNLIRPHATLPTRHHC